MPDALRAKRVFFVPAADSQNFNDEIRLRLLNEGLELVPLDPDSAHAASIDGAVIAFDNASSLAPVVQLLIGLRYETPVIHSFIYPNGLHLARLPELMYAAKEMGLNYEALPLALMGDALSRAELVGHSSSPGDPTLTFDSQVTHEQIVATLTAFANYYRACGGVGLPAEFESQEASVLEDVNV